MKTLGQVAFEAYSRDVERSMAMDSGLSRVFLQAVSATTWEKIGGTNKEAWEAAADAVRRNIPNEVDLGGGY